MMKLTLKSTVKLNNGIEIPLLGLGTYKMSKEEAEQATLHALKTGYRHIDTARRYDNEDAVGRAIKKSGIPREDIFVTTKLWITDFLRAERTFEQSRAKLGLDYVDLYLLHFPVSIVRKKAWKSLEKLYKEGRCKAIGVSNFTISHLTELLKVTDVVPAVNQVEFHPYLYQKKLWDFCKSKKIQLEAYSPLTHGKRLADPKLLTIAEKYNKTPAQILIRWHLQKNIVVIPKSVSPQRIEENASVFDFDIKEADMKKLDNFNENLRTCWNPEKVP